jgi:sulfite exporter TauE/SafE
MNLLKSLLHNIGVVIVGLALAFLGTRSDVLFDIPEFRSTLAIVGGCVLLALGFLLRVWATWYFYANHMKVIKLSPQKT